MREGVRIQSWPGKRVPPLFWPGKGLAHIGKESGVPSPSWPGKGYPPVLTWEGGTPNPDLGRGYPLPKCEQTIPSINITFPYFDVGGNKVTRKFSCVNARYIPRALHNRPGSVGGTYSTLLSWGSTPVLSWGLLPVPEGIPTEFLSWGYDLSCARGTLS